MFLFRHRVALSTLQTMSNTKAIFLSHPPSLQETTIFLFAQLKAVIQPIDPIKATLPSFRFWIENLCVPEQTVNTNLTIA